MKTVIQEIIDKYYQSSIYRCEFTEWLIENKDLLLEKEKKQIIDAHLNGQSDHHFSFESRTNEAEQYYYDLYNQSIKKITITELNKKK